MIAQLDQASVDGDSASTAMKRGTITALMGADVAIVARLKELDAPAAAPKKCTDSVHGPSDAEMRADRERRILRYIVVPFMRNELDPPYE
jgi:hypothetical protein